MCLYGEEKEEEDPFAMRTSEISCEDESKPYAWGARLRNALQLPLNMRLEVLSPYNQTPQVSQETTPGPDASAKDVRASAQRNSFWSMWGSQTGYAGSG